MRKIIVHTRQNRKGNWWCNATINGCDESIEGETMSSAKAMMMDKIMSLNAVYEVEWTKPEIYMIEDDPKILFGFMPVRLDHNPFG